VHESGTANVDGPDQRIALEHVAETARADPLMGDVWLIRWQVKLEF
jgi:hypothetical protein